MALTIEHPHCFPRDRLNKPKLLLLIVDCVTLQTAPRVCAACITFDVALSAFTTPICTAASLQHVCPSCTTLAITSHSWAWKSSTHLTQESGGKSSASWKVGEFWTGYLWWDISLSRRVLNCLKLVFVANGERKHGENKKGWDAGGCVFRSEPPAGFLPGLSWASWMLFCSFLGRFVVPYSPQLSSWPEFILRIKLHIAGLCLLIRWLLKAVGCTEFYLSKGLNTNVCYIFQGFLFSFFFFKGRSVSWVVLSCF